MRCTKCGFENRGQSKFCAKCGAGMSAPPPSVPAPRPLPIRSPGVTKKVCPHCATQNLVNAQTCSACGYTFVSRHVSRSKPVALPKKSIWLVVGLALILSLFGLRSFSARPDASTVVPADPLDRALAATVQLLVPDDSTPGTFSTGSGSVLSSNGYILTNFHVIGEPSTGHLYNREGAILVGVSSPGMSASPDVRYLAELVDSDLDLDLALIRIVSFANGNRLPGDLSLVAITVGDSSTVGIGDELTILGYPGLGGSTVTLTRGSVAGFLPDDGWIKTDAEINPGNSGGVAINEHGELVGIPTAGKVEVVFPGKLGLVRPVNLANDLIRQVRD